DHALVGEARDQVDLLVGKWMNNLTENCDRAAETVVLDHRHQQEGSGAAKLSQFDDWREAGQVGRLLRDIGYVNQLPGCNKPSQRIDWRWDHDWIAQKGLGKGGRQIEHRGAAETSALVKHQEAELCVTDRDCTRQDRLEHGIEFTG